VPVAGAAATATGGVSNPAGGLSSGGNPPASNSGGTPGTTGGFGTAGGMGGNVAGGSSGVGAGGSSGAGATSSAGAAGVGGAGTTKPPPSLIGAVAFSTPSQSFKTSLDVGMTTAVAGAEIRYTTDGTLPSASSTLYAGTPLALTATTQLRAQPFVAGAASGAVSTALYILRTFDLSSDLPIVLVDGYGKGEPTDKNTYKDAAVMVFEPVSGTASLTALPTLAARAGWHLRGQSSANFPQAPYKVELWDNANKDADYPVIGMPADSDWALIPPYYDRTLVRNPFVYTLGHDMGMEAPRVKYAEVYLNWEARGIAESDYQGIYWVTETIKNNKVRTNLKQLKESDTVLPQISGGYIFKFDQLAAEEPKIACTGSNPISGGLGGGGGGGMRGTCWTDLEVVDPDPLGAEQKAWLAQYIQTFHNALHATPIGDYAQYIDVPSFVDYLLVNELTRNVDAYVRSAYFFKDRDGKLKGGPLWDYNFALAVGGANTIDPMGGWQYAGSRNINNWFPKLTSDPAFMTLVKARWAALRQGLMADAALDQRITDMAAPLTKAITHDYSKWPVATVMANSGIVRGPTVTTWQEQLQAMRTFVSARTAWMDSQLK
jgi:hypothetical protein